MTHSTVKTVQENRYEHAFRDRGPLACIADCRRQQGRHRPPDQLPEPSRTEVRGGHHPVEKHQEHQGSGKDRILRSVPPERSRAVRIVACRRGRDGEEPEELRKALPGQ